MINKQIFLFITVVTAYIDDIYGILQLNEMKNFTVTSSFTEYISFLSFQGPIKFAKVTEDGKLIELNPIPGTYFFYDKLDDNPSKKPLKYTVYGSIGGAKFPQYRFSQIPSYYNMQNTLFMTYKNQSVQYRSEKGYLILDIPIIVQRDGSFANKESYLINIGYEEDKELLKLGYYISFIANKPQKYVQYRDNKMTFSNYYTTVYIKMDPRDNYNYFAVICEHQNLPLGGSTFAITYPISDSNTWIQILFTIILVFFIVVVDMYLKKIKKYNKKQEEQQNLQQSSQKLN